MNMDEIKLFIETMIYDFETVRYLKNYGRLKETVPIMNQILSRLQNFENPIGKKDLQHDFWKVKFNQHATVEDMYRRITEFTKQGSVRANELEAIDYEGFILFVQSWVLKYIVELKQVVKSPFLKKMEIYFIGISVGVIVLSVLLYFFKSFFIGDWGLRGNFYNGTNFNKEAFATINKSINFDPSYLGMDPRIHQNKFSAKWEGLLVVPQSGKYTFYIKANDGVRLIIDDHLIINEWHKNNVREVQQEIELSKGNHSIVLFYFNESIRPELKLFWAYENNQRQVIHPWYLRLNQTFTFSSESEILNFSPKDVETGIGWMQNLDEYNLPVNSILLAKNPNGEISLIKKFVIPKAGIYKVTLIGLKALDYVNAVMTVSDIAKSRFYVDLSNPSLVAFKTSYICIFTQGENTIRLTGLKSKGKKFLGVNRIVIETL